MNTRTVLLAIVVFALAGAPTVRAADSDDAAQKGEIKLLLEMVRDLQRRVSALEARGAEPAPAATATPPAVRSAPPAPTQVAPQASEPAPKETPTVPQAAPIAADRPGANTAYMSPEAALKASWNQVDAGMDEAAIKTLLGPPSTTFRLGARLVWYYYYPGTGRGSVFFTDAGRVSSYQSPFPGFGW